MSALTYDREHFYLDGKEFCILSGSIHYFRIVPEYWEDRLRKLKECGMNTVTTYTCWNLHERKRGCFDFSGMLDIGAFIDKAKDLGLMVILRPGPYICGEWEMGGLPSWLLGIPGIGLRCCQEDYLTAAGDYLKELFVHIRPRLYENGGNVIAVQLENEYGSYGNDSEYLERLAEIYRESGMTGMWFTSDGPGYFMLNGGGYPGTLAAANFGSNPKDNFALLKSARPDQPLFCAEYWNGWFDHWYGEHHSRGASDTAKVYEEMLRMGANVNFYMFHGGTNFGLMNGANFENGNLCPTVTSYDYNAPLTESGDLTEKYYAVRAVNEKLFGPLEPLTVRNLPRSSYGKVEFTQTAALFEQLSALTAPVVSPYPQTMEEIGQNYGLLLYRTVLGKRMEELELTIDGLGDRASIYRNRKLLGIMENTGKRMDPVRLGNGEGEETVLDILVENLGRVNYGGHILDRKGIERGVRLANQYLFGWTMYPFDPMEYSAYPGTGNARNLAECLTWSEEAEHAGAENEKGPVFYKGELRIDGTRDSYGDTFLKTEGFGKGYVWVNGFLLGRYWNTAGPQRTLYLPGPLLHSGENELILLELDGFTGEGTPGVILTDQEEL